MKASDLAEYLDHDPFLEEPAKPQRSAETAQDKSTSDIVRMVMDIFTGARWTTREEYKRASAIRDRKGRKKRE